MIDFHSHILPGMDDGSASVAESVKMLRVSYRGGVDQIIATPHFYARKESPDTFLARRERALAQLAPSLTEDMPRIYTGAEVYYYTGIAYTQNLQKLCIEGTDILLLEMPFHGWQQSMIDEVTTIAQETELTVLLAHIDRYTASQKPETWDILADNDVLFQVNASAFLNGWMARRKAFALLRDQRIAVLGSDCHNMQERKPNLDAAFAVIEKKSGRKAADKLKQNAQKLLDGRFRS